eukprot:907886-Prorocentrum_minimum.AAC.1
MFLSEDVIQDEFSHTVLHGKRGLTPPKAPAAKVRRPDYPLPPFQPPKQGSSAPPFHSAPPSTVQVDFP